jgi:hypothetical protein
MQQAGDDAGASDLGSDLSVLQRQEMPASRSCNFGACIRMTTRQWQKGNA